MRKKNVNFGIRNKKNRITNTPNKFLSFPSPAILESYEEIYPGFTEKLLELTKIEQNQRENYNKNLIKSMNFTIRISQVLSFIFSILVLYTSVNFFKNGLVSLGAVLFITWFLFLLILNIKYSLLNKGLDIK